MYSMTTYNRLSATLALCLSCILWLLTVCLLCDFFCLFLMFDMWFYIFPFIYCRLSVLVANKGYYYREPYSIALLLRFLNSIKIPIDWLIDWLIDVYALRCPEMERLPVDVGCRSFSRIEHNLPTIQVHMDSRHYSIQQVRAPLSSYQVTTPGKLFTQTSASITEHNARL